MKRKFVIQDWAGNVCFNGEAFKTFEDAWSYIYEKFEHLDDDAAEEEFQEYEVTEVSK